MPSFDLSSPQLDWESIECVNFSMQRSVKQGRSPDIWVATDKGVAHFDGVKWTSYTTNDGLLSDDIRGVSSMHGKGVWAATAKGAAYFDRASNTWIDLTHNNELVRQEMTGVLFVPFVGADHSKVWFSTANNGLITFTPLQT